MEPDDVKDFLAWATERMELDPGRCPFNKKEGYAVLAWLKAAVERWRDEERHAS